MNDRIASTHGKSDYTFQLAVLRARSASWE